MRRLIVVLAALMLLAGCDITGMIFSPPEGTIVVDTRPSRSAA